MFFQKFLHKLKLWYWNTLQRTMPKIAEFCVLQKLDFVVKFAVRPQRVQNILQKHIQKVMIFGRNVYF